MIPQKRAELSEWIRQELGEPVFDAIPIAGIQVENCIDNALDYYQTFAGQFGNETQYVVINTAPLSVLGPCALSGGPFSFCDPSIAAPFLQNRAEWQLPKNVISVVEALPGGNGAFDGLSWLTQAPQQDIIERGLNAAESMSNVAMGNLMGGGPINTSTNNYIGLFFPGTLYSGGAYGTRGGVRGDGGGMDVITMELGMEYMEMLNQRYRVHVRLDFHSASKKLRIAPPPKDVGSYIIQVVAKVAPEHLYDDLFIRTYARALAMMQVGRTLQLYKGQKFVGGVEFNGDFYYNEGKAERDKLEEEVLANKWGEPPQAFYIG